MKNFSLKPLSGRCVPALAAVIAAGLLGATSVSAQQFVNNFGDGINTDPESPWFGGGDNLWSNAANWNAPIPEAGTDWPNAWINVSAAHDEFNQDLDKPAGGPATINYAAPSIGEMIIGQDGGSGHVLMTSGGSITATALTMAWANGRHGIFDQNGGSVTFTAAASDIGRPDGGTANINISNGTFQSGALNVGWSNTASNMTVSGGTVTTGNVRLSSAHGTGSTATSSLNVSGGDMRLGALHANGLAGTGVLEIGHTGGNASVEVTGGVLRAGNVQVANLITTTAEGSLTVTGGFLHANQIGVGASGGTGVGDFTIGGDATVTTANHIFLRPDGRGNFTVEGSNATITLNRVGQTGFEVTNGSVVNFVGDAGGFSPVNIPQSTMRFSGPDGVLNVDASDVGLGLFDLFAFDSYFAGDHNSLTNRWGEVDVVLADASWTWELHFNPQSIQLEIIPEPSTYAAIFGGLALLGVMVRRRFRK